MADEPRAEAAGHSPAFDFQAGAGIFYFRLRIDNPWLVAGLFGGSTLALGAFYISHRGAVDTAVKIALAGLADRVLKIRPSSVLVEFVCYTKERFLAFMDAFATGTVKQRLQEELSKIGFKDKLEVTVTVYDIESEMRKEEEWRISGFELPSYSVFSTAHSMESGAPTDGELFELACDIEDRWRRLGHCLGMSEDVLDVIDQEEWPTVSMKGYCMLRYWKRAATVYYMYNVLDGALRHEDVQRQDLAEKFCQGEHKMELHPSGLNILSEELMTVAAGAPSVKVGTPTDDELYELAHDIESEWIRLGRYLGFLESVLAEIDTQWKPLSEKGYHLLTQWKQERGGAASYKVLNDALQHVQRQDLADKFCQGGDIMEFKLSGFTKLRKEKQERTSEFEPPSDSGFSGVKSMESVKVGTPTDDELYELAFVIADSWKELGHLLGVSEAELNKIDQDFEMLSKKGYHMLIYWKRNADASYKVLNDALGHKDIQRQDLAEKFCQG